MGIERGEPGRVDRATTEIQTRPPAELASLELPVLTVLYHPELARVGERAVLAGLGTDGRALSRLEPLFAQPDGTSPPRPLEDTRVSRAPVWLRVTAGGGVRIDSSQSRTSLEIDGEPVTGVMERGTEALAGGVQLLLGGQVVLLLHLADPQLAAPGETFGLVGQSAPMLRLRREIHRLADLDVPVLLRGETGTGKELVARALHAAGPRRRGPYVALNMAAVPPELAAAELFGNVQGAFTGATRARRGHFLQADGGTLFLDEVGEMPQEVQALLLRALESGEIQPLGADTTRRVSVRLVSATDSDLESAIAEKTFRAPVLHRLSGFVLHLPPLRERRDDFGRLFVHFLRLEAESVGESQRLAPAKQPWVGASLVARWARWHWPGNVRQLRNAVRQLVIAHRGCDEVAMSAATTPALVRMFDGAPAARQPRSPAGKEPVSGAGKRAAELGDDEVVAALRQHGYRLQATADYLGISRPSLYDRMKKIPRLHTAAELGHDEIARARERWAGDVSRMAAELKVSERALRRRIGQLDE